MKTIRTRNLLAAALVCALAVTTAHAQQQTQTVDTRIGKLDFELGLPTDARGLSWS
jgi:hypothetical protein